MSPFGTGCAFEGAMCGNVELCWMFSLTSLLVFAGLMVASVFSLVRSFDRKPENPEDE
jgi:hypothetical protein